ncbi:uncharacterized protein LOC124295112 [Neodiprion lecontei]|uniref:Uncharacterized protein LOC124295112 n=1 Tax=Neodiprion lecontei TaxID=441921 RepID=A0ABM3GH48_NEOLC|nr:uncharacterized protein LOC124295112 [Neodiprion lecontei]
MGAGSRSFTSCCRIHKAATQKYFQKDVGTHFGQTSFRKKIPATCPIERVGPTKHRREAKDGRRHTTIHCKKSVETHRPSRVADGRDPSRLFYFRRRFPPIFGDGDVSTKRSGGPRRLPHTNTKCFAAGSPDDGHFAEGRAIGESFICGASAE